MQLAVISETSQPSAAELCEASFTFDAPAAKQVLLAGEFNDWDGKSAPMRRDGDGVWRTTLRLPPGFYHYKFVVDGRWMCRPDGCGDRHCDRCCERCVPNLHGTMELVAVVG